jgi:hypothetical protein
MSARLLPFGAISPRSHASRSHLLGIVRLTLPLDCCTCSTAAPRLMGSISWVHGCTAKGGGLLQRPDFRDPAGYAALIESTTVGGTDLVRRIRELPKGDVRVRGRCSVPHPTAYEEE